jgi:hypothetical protein
MSATFVDAAESVRRPCLPRVEPQEAEAYLKQYVEGLSGEHARRLACRSGESAIAAEAFMNSVG